MTIGDEKIVAWLCTERTDGKVSERKMENPFIATNRAYVLAHPRHNWQPLYSHSAYAELAADRHSLISAALYTASRLVEAESQLAELRGKVEELIADWQDSAKQPIYPVDVRDTYTECANELRTLAAADGGLRDGA